MPLAVQKLAAITFFLIGASHVLQPRVWAEFFLLFRRQGEAGSFLAAFLHFPLGAVIVAFHDVWRGIPLVLTLVGWGLVVKGLLYFVSPRHGVRMLSRGSLERAWEFRVVGVFSLVLSAVIAWPLLER